jgi:hypothetical protein
MGILKTIQKAKKKISKYTGLPPSIIFWNFIAITFFLISFLGWFFGNEDHKTFFILLQGAGTLYWLSLMFDEVDLIENFWVICLIPFWGIALILILLVGLFDLVSLFNKWFDSDTEEESDTEKECEACNGAGTGIFSCCTGDPVDSDFMICPVCKEHLGIEECSECNGTGINKN